MGVFAISDIHLGDETGIEERGFETIEIHDNFIINSWNSVITEKDTVFVLGDVTRKTSKPYPLLNLLNGTKHLILGNNDRPEDTPELLKYFKTICGAFRYKNILMTHIPVVSSEIYEGSFNLHGHIHKQLIINEGTKQIDPRYINLCCEMVDYLPQPLTNWVNLDS